MDKLINALPAILRAANNAEEVNQAACLAAWKHAVGESLGAHAIAVEVVDQILVVAVADGMWQKQLESMRSHLLYRLNSVLGQPLVQSIQFRVHPEMIASRRNAAQPRANIPGDVPAELLQAAAEIHDAKLRRVFLGAATSCVNRNEKSRNNGR